MITALSSLYHLWKLKLSGEPSEWDMTDGHMDVLARSAPNLQSISIAFEQRLEDSNVRKIYLTHATLLSLVQHCRQLAEIELPMDLSQADDSAEKPVGFASSVGQGCVLPC
ncbi:hypothetical protein FRB95_004310 [Tulasnella sp. JGI-2019a]|nr:hypothetical protein FRB95_004310 [Tulasnella sp. JGI-2019a]